MRTPTVQCLVALAFILGLAQVAVPQALLPLQPASAPNLTLAAHDLDLGVFPYGTANGAQALTIRNTGLTPLQIRTIRTSCTCLQVTPRSATIPPGADTTVRVTLDLRFREGALAAQLLIYSNDPVKPLVKVGVRAQVDMPITWTPKLLPLGWVPRTAALPQLRFHAIRLMRHDGQPIGPVRITTSAPYLAVDPIADPSGGYRLRTRLGAAVPLGPLEETIRVETQHPAMPVIEIPVRGGILGEVYATVHWLDFGLVEPGKPAMATFLVKNVGERELTILKAEPHLAALAEVQTARKERDIEVSVRLPNPPPLRNLDGRVDLYTDHPEHSWLSVPLRGWVWAPQPFEPTTSDGRALELLALIKVALFRRQDVTAADFVTRILGGVRDERAASLLLQAFGDDHWHIRARAAEVLGVLGHVAAVEPLRQAVTDDPDEEVRRAALTALAQLTPTQAIPTLLLAIQDNDAWVREDAATMLGQIGAVHVVPQLRALLADPDEHVRGAAGQAIRMLEGGQE